MDDIYKKLNSSFFQSNKILSIAALSNPLHHPNWNSKLVDNSVLKVLTGNSLDIWEEITKSQRFSNSNVLKAITGSSLELWKEFTKPDRLNISNTLKAITGNSILFSDNINTSNALKFTFNSPINNYLSLKDLPSFFQKQNDKIWTDSLIALSGNTIKTQYISDWNRPFKEWYPLEVETIKEEAETDDTITSTIERFVDNVSTIYSKVENFNDIQKSQFAINIEDVLNYEVEKNKTVPTFSTVLDWLLSKYNQSMESAIVTNNVQEIKNIHLKLKSITIVGWISIIISLGIAGVIENQASEAFNNLRQDDEIEKGKTVPTVNFNAATNSERKVHIEPDGRTKIVCIIPDCTEVQLGEVHGKYIAVSVLVNGVLKRGFCLNENFITPRQLQ